jgi:hypothetical protein
MQPEQRRILYIVIIAIVVILAVTLGLVFGLRKSDDEEQPNTKPEVDVMNSYDNTAELIKKFPVINNTTVLSGMEEHIQNRLLTGFENWNRGFKTWKAWGNILYTNESIYNVHGARLSLAHYQAAMDISLKQATIIMGDFHNMLISDQYCGIHYDFYSGSKDNLRKSKVMEFVKFHEYGNETNPDTRVEEGWGSTKDSSYDGLINFQGDDERQNQTGQDEYNLNYQIPENDDLTKKYIIKYPTTYRDANANQILDIILKGFDSWNTKEAIQYCTWVEKYFDENATSSSLDERERNMTQYKAEITELFQNNTIYKLYFDNFLIRDNWAAIHYRYRKEDKKGIEKYVGDRMEFFKFEEKEGGLKIMANWIQ